MSREAASRRRTIIGIAAGSARPHRYGASGVASASFDNQVHRVRDEAVRLAMDDAGSLGIGASTRQKILPLASSTQ